MNNQKETNLKVCKAQFKDCNHRGQIAIGFIVILGFILLMVMSVTQIGQLSQVKVETSNASDAGALAAASWIVSGQNEGALIAQRMEEAIDTVQALFLVPFCPDDVNIPGNEQVDYANAVWSSLVRHPVNIGFCTVYREAPGTPWNRVIGFANDSCGLNAYFEQVANGVMESAWNMGRREYLTAAINNMLIRFAVGIDVKGINSNLYQEISDWQERLYDTPGQASTSIQDLAWHNGRLDNTQTPPTPVRGEFLYHTPTYHMTGYPVDPPQLTMKDWSLPFLQYETGWTGSFFSCIPVPAFGIEENLLTGPMADLDLVRPLPTRPLAMDSSGLKQWQKIDLSVVLPLQDVNEVLCSIEACGMMIDHNTMLARVKPSAIEIQGRPDVAEALLGAKAAITVEIAHRVQTANAWQVGGDPSDPPDCCPDLEDIPLLPEVFSESTVHITSSQDINPTIPDAQANIFSVK